MNDAELVEAVLEHMRRDGYEVTEEQARERLAALRAGGLIAEDGRTTDEGNFVLERLEVVARMSGTRWPSKIK